jgi:hypothetical protein
MISKLDFKLKGTVLNLMLRRTGKSVDRRMDDERYNHNILVSAFAG